MCQRCEIFYQKYPLQEGEDGREHRIDDVFSNSPVKCAFEKGKFDHDNWNCETMNQLREHCDFERRDDMSAACIGVIHIPDVKVEDLPQQGYIVMTWYKQRGKTGQSYVMCDDDVPEPLTLETAEYVLAQKVQNQ